MRRDAPLDRLDDVIADLKRLGSQLRALREAQGLSYENVADATHVRPHVLQAIEDGRIDEVAAPVYARGFIKTYCEYLMAADLWKKYSQQLSSVDDPKAKTVDAQESSVEIKHPTPIFRRSSIIWVYIILVIAVICAAYLLWSQHNDPSPVDGAFALRFSNLGSQDVIASAEPPVSQDLISLVSEDLAAALSADVAPAMPPLPRSAETAASPDRAGTPVNDLSWMDGPVSGSVRSTVELPQLADRNLLIEITGSNVRLTVEQGGKVVTRRNLGVGGRRSYEVNRDTTVTIGTGDRARVTWFGRRYESVGSDGNSITLVFHPDGTVSVTNGKSPHFGAVSSGDNG
jgi:transcriptional regulator with XRE-family HTH domain